MLNSVEHEKSFITLGPGRDSSLLLSFLYSYFKIQENRCFVGYGRIFIGIINTGLRFETLFI